MKKFIKGYRIELIALSIVLVGIFLLVEQFNIRQGLIGFLSLSLAFVRDIANRFVLTLESYITSFSLSDLLGWVFVLLAGGFIIWRLRYRVLHSPSWLSETCPRCGGATRRVHRTRFDRLLGAGILPHSRRFRCINTDCDWSGLRHHQHRERSSKQHEEALVGTFK